MKRPEQQLHAAVVQHLEVRAAPDTFYFHPANGGFRRPIEAAVFRSLGVRAGVPDLIFVRRGQVFALELKAPGGRLSPAQLECHARLRKAGAVVSTAADIDAALRFLELNRLVRGTVQ